MMNLGIASVLLLGGTGAAMQQVAYADTTKQAVYNNATIQTSSVAKQSKPLFEVDQQIIRKSNLFISYPQISGLTSELAMQAINQDLENIANRYIENMYMNDALSLYYKVTSTGPNFISFVFMGTYKQNLIHGKGGEAFPLLENITYESNNFYRVTSQNLLRTDKQSMKAFNKLFTTYAKVSGAGSNVKYGDYMGMYITDKNVVFYYMKDDFASRFTRVTIPMEKIKPFFNKDIKPLDHTEYLR